ncbi:hypothetical protein EON64_00245 [archaeon]|nr:MAG: hypothetical protein EON64_00245 [archaeon]
MDPIALQSTLLDIFNKSRLGKGLGEAFDAEDLTSNLSAIAQSSAVHILTVPEEAPEDVNNWVENQVIDNLEKVDEGNVSADISELVSVLYDS